MSMAAIGGAANEAAIVANAKYSLNIGGVINEAYKCG